MSSICACAAQSGVFPIGQHFIQQMTVLLLLRRGVNQARIRRRILRLEILDRLEVARVGDDFGEFLQLLELIQLCFSLPRQQCS